MTIGRWLSFFSLALLIPTLILMAACVSSYKPSGWDVWLSQHITSAWLGPARMWKDAGLFAVIGAMGLVYWCYSCRWLKAGTETFSLREILTGIAPVLILQLAVIPFHSRDIYGYINRGVQQAVSQVNPYLVTVGQLPGWQNNPMFHEHWVFNPSPYGFFFTRLTQWLVSLTPETFVTAFLSFKLLSLMVFLLMVQAVWQLAGRLKTNNTGQWLAPALAAFSPLLVLHTLGNGHNDLLMTLLLLWSLLALFSQRWAWLCLPLLTLSVLVKYASLLATPFLLITLIRQRAWRPLLTGGCLSLLLLIMLGAPYLPHPGEMLPLAQMGGNASMSQHSLHSALARTVYYFGLLFHQDWLESARRFFKVFLWTAFSGFYLQQCRRYWRDSRQTVQPTVLIQAIALVLVAMVAFASSKYHSWYAGMFLPLVFLLPPESKLFRFGYAFSLVQLLAFTPLENIHILSALLFLGVPLWWTLKGNNPSSGVVATAL